MIDIEIECVSCDGTGVIEDVPCSACEGYGVFRMDDCPRCFVGESITEAINACGFAEKGVLPILGGTLDQSAWFLDCWRLLTNEQAKIDNDKLNR